MSAGEEQDTALVADITGNLQWEVIMTEQHSQHGRAQLGNKTFLGSVLWADIYVTALIWCRLMSSSIAPIIYCYIDIAPGLLILPHNLSVAFNLVSRRYKYIKV